MHKLQTNLKILSCSTRACFGTSVPYSGIAHIKFKTGLPKHVLLLLLLLLVVVVKDLSLNVFVTELRCG